MKNGMFGWLPKIGDNDFHKFGMVYLMKNLAEKNRLKEMNDTLEKAHERQLVDINYKIINTAHGRFVGLDIFHTAKPKSSRVIVVTLDKAKQLYRQLSTIIEKLESEI